MTIGLTINLITIQPNPSAGGTSVKSGSTKTWVISLCFLLTAVAAHAALPPKLGIQPLFPDFVVFRGGDQWHAGYTLVAGAGAVPPVPAAVPGGARRRPRGRPARVLWQDPRLASPRGLRRTISHHSSARNGLPTPSRPSPGQKQCSPISPATPIASPSRTVASLLSTSAA